MAETCQARPSQRSARFHQGDARGGVESLSGVIVASSARTASVDIGLHVRGGRMVDGRSDCGALGLVGVSSGNGSSSSDSGMRETIDAEDDTHKDARSVHSLMDTGGGRGIGGLFDGRLPPFAARTFASSSFQRRKAFR